MHLSSASVSCSDARPNATSLSTNSSRKTSSPITVTTSLCTISFVSTSPRRRPRSIRLRHHHPTRRKSHPYSSRFLTYQPAADLEDPNVLIEDPNIDRDTNAVGVPAGVSSADREHPIYDGRRRRASGTHSIPHRAPSSDRSHLMRVSDTGQKSQEADIRKEATSILSWHYRSSEGVIGKAPRSHCFWNGASHGMEGIERDPDLSHGGTTEGTDEASGGGEHTRTREDERQDLEQGHHHPTTAPASARGPYAARSQSSLRSHPSAAASRLSPDPADNYAWGPSHPCFPHPNPHVPLSSPLHATTRVIRIKRDWMVAADQAPAFSNLYPEILDPVLPEREFRSIVKHVNDELVRAFDPWTWRNWIDALLGLLTGWVWDDLGWTGVKARLRAVEAWLEEWNAKVGVREGVRVVGLRRTGYLTLDIQIPDPHVGIVPLAPDSRPPTANPSRPVTRPSTAGGLEPRLEG